MITAQKLITMCDEALHNRPTDPWVYVEFSKAEYHMFIKKQKPQLGFNIPYQGINGEIVSQADGKVLVKYNAKDLMNKLKPQIKA